MCTARLFSHWVDLFALNIYLDTVVLINSSLVLTQYGSVKDRRTDGHAVAYTALAKLALRRAVNKCLANAKRPCDCRVLCLRLKSSLYSCAHSTSDMTSFGCHDQGRDSVRLVL